MSGESLREKIAALEEDVRKLESRFESRPAPSASGPDDGRPFRALVERAPVPLCQLSAIRDDEGAIRDFVCRYMNPAALRACSMGEREMVGLLLLDDLLRGEDPDSFVDACREVVNDGEDRTARGFRLPCGRSADTDEIVPLHVAVSKLFDGVIVVWRDPAEDAFSSATLKRAQSEIEEDRQHRTEMLATLGHELKTPINAILGLCHLLEEEISGSMNAEQLRHLSRIERSCHHLSTLVEDALTSMRDRRRGVAPVHSKEVDVVEMVQDVVKLLEPEARRRGLDLQVGCPDSPLKLHTDAGKLRQILTNLVDNALKYTEEGEVGVEVEPREDDWLCLRVRDTGPGIPEDRLEEIFEPYVQLERASEGGSGLGLALCKRLARLLGGDVDVESRPGEGSTFTCEVPRSIQGSGGAGQSDGPPRNGTTAPDPTSHPRPAS